jgi:hypothetical protein
MRQTRRMGQNTMSGVQIEIPSVVFDYGAGSAGHLVGGVGGRSMALRR